MAAPSEGRGLDELDRFKAEFKYYKRKQPQPDLSNVIDFNKAGESTHLKVFIDLLRWLCL